MLSFQLFLPVWETIGIGNSSSGRTFFVYYFYPGGNQCSSIFFPSSFSLLYFYITSLRGMDLLLDCIFFFFSWNKICGEGEDYSNFIFGLQTFSHYRQWYLWNKAIFAGKLHYDTDCNLWESTFAEKMCLYQILLLV